MPLTKLATVVDANSAGRVDLVVKNLANVSRSQVRGMIDHGCVSVNGSRCKLLATTVEPGDVVELRYDLNQRYREKKKPWDDRTFTIVFEDEHIIVIEKVAGVLTVPQDRTANNNSVLERVSNYLSHSRKKREAFVVHGLDRAVSGLMVFAKNDEAAEVLIEQFKKQEPKRIFTAIVAGVMKMDTGSYHSHLTTGKNLDRYSTKPSSETEAAVTHYKVLSRMADATKVEVTLETGRRHQIRVQFADAGHPVLGDPRYKTKAARHPRWIRKRIALHARQLTIQHPVNGEELTFESPMPKAMKDFMAKNRLTGQ